MDLRKKIIRAGLPALALVLATSLGGPVPAGIAASADGTVSVRLKLTDDRGRTLSEDVWCMAFLEEASGRDIQGEVCEEGSVRFRVAPGRYRVSVSTEPPYSGGYYVRSGGRLRLTGDAARSETIRRRGTVFRIGKDTTLPPVALILSGRMVGTVRNAAGKVVPDAEGRALRGPTDPVGVSRLREDIISGIQQHLLGGSFTVTDLRTGTYRLAVNRQSGPSLYAGGYYAGPGRKVTTNWSRAKPVGVAWGKATTGVDATVWSCATISGRIVGHVADVAQVTVFNDSDHRLVTRSTMKISKSGRFAVTGLLPGKYFLAVDYTRLDRTGWGVLVTDTWTTFHGTDSTHRPTGPTVTVPSCTKVSGLVVDTDKYFVRLSGPLIYGGDNNTYPVARVGHKLYGIRGTWTGPNLRYSYQWLRDGRPIPGANTIDRTVTTADVGHSLNWRVTVTATTASGRTMTKSVVTPWPYQAVDPRTWK